MQKILIADDHAIVRKGIRQILLEEFPFAEVAEVADAEELITQSMSGDWDVIISDLSMPGRSGLDALVQIKQLHPDIPVLIISMHPEEQYAIRVLKAGASGYLSKDLAQSELITAVKNVFAGKRYISPTLAEHLASHLDKDQHKKLPHESLSDREFEVLKHLAVGVSVSEIASALLLSVTTVSTYRSRILNKMNMKTNADLTLYCLNQKLI